MSAMAAVSQVQCLKGIEAVKPFVERIGEAGLYPLRSSHDVKTLQVNVGKACNLRCKHCHVEAGPGRTESMTRETMSSCLQVLADNRIPTLDITGGSPELNPDLPWLIAEAGKLGRHVMVRTNLAVLRSEPQARLPEFYAGQAVEVVASLPYYSEKDVDRQRGAGVFQDSIAVLSRLNELGYGRPDGRLVLNLAYNPNGAFLPPSEPAIEAEYRRALRDRYGILFNHLFTITNVPAGRFLAFLTASGNLQGYMQRLAGAFNPAAVSRVMCRDMVSVGWDGQLYDCDFNQMLGLNCSPGHIESFSLDGLRERQIRLGNHCYSCTAGAGSSCGGATV
jgi:radical SAM/Cys-rich protein